MATFTAGTSFTDGVTGDVTASKLNALVANATPLANLITDRTAETSIATDDLVMISDTSESGAINKMTVANLMKAELTGTINSTAGTIGTLNSTTGTITTGVIPTLTSTTLITSGTGTASAPAIVPTGDTNTGIFFPAADTIAFSEGGTESMRIDSSGNVGIGTTTPSAKLHVVGEIKSERIGIPTQNGKITFENGNYEFDSSTNLNYVFKTNGTERLRIDSSGNVGIGTTSPSIDWSGDARALRINGSGTQACGVRASNANGSAELVISGTTSLWGLYSPSNLPFALYTNSTERLRITSDGNFLVGKTQASSSVAGAWINTNGRGLFTSDADAPLYANRLTNDGTLVEFQQASTLEGSISVSGTTVSYNGGHLSRFSQLPSGQRDLSIKKGTVLSNLDEMCVWSDAEGNPLPNEQLNRVKISDVEGDSNVAGIFVNWDNDDKDNPFDLNMAMTGDMIIRIAQGVSINRGDLLMSAGDGTAKPQGDDVVKAKTIAKVTSTNVTCTYEDGSYCVPCVLMAC